MKTTRRTFLRALGSAIIGAAAVPALPTNLVTFTSELYEVGDMRAYKLWGDVVVDPEPPPWVASALDHYSWLFARSMAHYQTLARDTGLVYDVELAA